MRWLFVPIVAASWAVIAVAGCVGDDPEGGGGSDTDSGRPDGPGGSSGSSGGADATSDGPAPPSGPCDLEKPFGKPAKIAEISTPTGQEEGPRLSPDGQELFVNEVVTAGTKPAAGIVRYLLGQDGKWSSRTALAVNDLGDGGLMHSRDLAVTGDSKTGYFHRADQFSFGHGISRITRTGPNKPWSSPIPVSVTEPDGTPSFAHYPWVSADGKRIYFIANGTARLHVATFGASGFGPSTLLGFDGKNVQYPVLSGDERTLYFGGNGPHPGGAPQASILVYKSTRASLTDPFAPPELVVELAEEVTEMSPTWLSPDGCKILLAGRMADGGTSVDVFTAEKPKP